MMFLYYEKLLNKVYLENIRHVIYFPVFRKGSMFDCPLSIPWVHRQILVLAMVETVLIRVMTHTTGTYLLIYLFVCLFACLFVCFFKVCSFIYSFSNSYRSMAYLPGSVHGASLQNPQQQQQQNSNNNTALPSITTLANAGITLLHT